MVGSPAWMYPKAVEGPVASMPMVTTQSSWASVAA